MGTSHDIRCIDCGENAGIHANHDPIRDWEVRPLIVAAPGLALFPDDLDFSLQHVGLYVPIQWFKLHGKHRLRVVTEYGEVDETCAQDIVCPTCGAHQYHACDLDIGHDGPHGKRSPK